MKRREIMIKDLDIAGSIGVEVGPLDKPLVHKDQGTILYVDHCGTEKLKSLWSKDPNVNTSAIHVDAVWGENTLYDARKRFFDC